MTTRRWLRLVEAWSALVRRATEEGWDAARIDAEIAKATGKQRDGGGAV